MPNTYAQVVEAREDRVSRIRAYLGRSEDDQDSILVASLRGLVTQYCIGLVVST